MKMNIGKLTRKGNNVYEDRSGRIFIHSKRLKCVYMVGKDKLKQFSIFQSRYIIPIIALILIGYYINWIVAVVISLVIYVVLELMYRFYFLKNLTILDEAVLPENSEKEKRYMAYSKTSNAIRSLIAIVFPCALWYNLITVNPEWANIESYTSDPNNIFLLGASMFCIVLSLKVFISAFSSLLKQLTSKG